MGKKAKSQTIGYKYSLGMVMTICHAPIDFVTELIFGEKSAWQGQTKDRRIYINKHDLFGGEKKEGGVAGSVTILSGKPDQQVNSYVETFRGETSAQRGLLTMVFGDEGYVPESDYRTIDWDKSTISETMYQGILRSIGTRIYKGSESYKWNRVEKDASNKAITALKILAGKQEGEITDELLIAYLTEITMGNREGYAFGESARDARNWNRPERRLGNIPQMREKYGTNKGVAMAYTKIIFIDSRAGWHEHGSYRNNGEHTVRFPESEFFGVEVRTKLKTLPQYTQPFYWGTSPYFKSTWVRVQAINSGWTHGLWYAEKATIDGGVVEYTEGGQKKTFSVKDMNPAHILYKTLTNDDWGMGYHPSDIDEESFRKAADKLYDEKFGMSIIWDSAKTIEDFNAEILDTIDGVIRVNVITGRFELILIRNDYTVSELPVLDESSIVEISRFERSAWGDGANEIVLTYKDRNESDVVLTKQNLAAIEIQRGVISSSQTYKGVHTKHIAELIAERELKLTSSSIAKMTLKINRLNYLLQNGDVFVLQWKNLGIKSMICRVGSIVRGEFDDGIIEVEAVEDVFGVTRSFYEVIAGEPTDEDFNRIVLTAEPIKNMRVMEASYHDLQTVIPAENLNSAIRLVDGGSAYPLVLAEKPSLATMNYDLYAFNGSGTFQKVADDVSFNATFRLAQNIDPMSETIMSDDFDNRPHIITNDMYIVVGDECFGIETIEDDGMIRVKRGILDTLPAYHYMGDIGYIVTVSNASDSNNYAVGSTLSYKTVAQAVSSSTDIQDSKEFDAELIGRAARPAPVNSVTINEEYFPAQVSRTKSLKLSWNTRNRKQMIPQNVYWGSGSVTPEEGQTTSVKVFNPEIEGNEGILYTVKNTEETSLTVNPPTSNARWDLGDMKTGLVYQYDMSKNPLNPVAGSNTKPAVTHGTGLTDGAVANTKVLELDYERWIDIPFDTALNSNHFTMIARVKLERNSIPIFAIGEIGEHAKTLGYQRFSLAIDGAMLKVFVGDEEPVYFGGEVDVGKYINNEWHTITATVDLDNWRIEAFIDEESVLIVDEKPITFPYSTDGAMNLFSIKDAIHNTIDENDTIYGVQSSQLVSDFIEVTPNTMYWLMSEVKNSHSDGYLFYGIYDADKTLIDEVVAEENYSTSADGLVERSMSFTTPENAKYVKVGGSYLQNGQGRLIFARVDDKPAYNLREGDKWLYELPETQTAYLGVRRHNGSDTYSDNGAAISDLLLYGRVLNETEMGLVLSKLIARKWPEFVGVEIETERNNLTSWQKFKWVVETTLFDQN